GRNTRPCHGDTTKLGQLQPRPGDPPALRVAVHADLGGQLCDDVQPVRSPVRMVAPDPRATLVAHLHPGVLAWESLQVHPEPAHVAAGRMHRGIRRELRYDRDRVVDHWPAGQHGLGEVARLAHLVTPGVEDGRNLERTRPGDLIGASGYSTLK